MTDDPSAEQALIATEQRMQRSVDVFGGDIDSIRTGRANPALLEGFRVDYYGATTPINQLATIASPDPRMLTIQPWDRQMVSVIEKEIMKSDLGLVPTSDGNIIRLPIPSMTAERRQDMIKRLKRMQEDAHVAIRNIRRDCMEQLRKLEKNKDLTEDGLRRAQEQLQKITDVSIGKADTLGSGKEVELTEV
jgi:ribosome recycling factor